ECSVDLEAGLMYVKDDIRSCTMQRSKEEEKLGIILKYHKHQKIHYVVLFEEHKETLAYRAGIKNYDRVIEYNKDNVECDTEEEYASRYDQNRLMPLTLLVCDPGTYAYYKRQRKTISSGLSTVIFMPPVLVSNSVDAHRTSCDGCGAVRFTTDRYKCLQCTNYDLCARCFERRRETKNHLSGHPVVQFRTPNEVLGRELRNNDLTLTNLKVLFQLEKHENISCDGCLLDPIVGLRFKCDTCPNYDLCHQCMTNSATTNSHKSDHPLVVVPKHRIPVIPRDDIELGDALGKGAFGTVYKATWLSKNRVVACKVITAPANLSEGLFKSFLKELAAYTELSGAYILKTYGYTQTELADGVNEYRLIMEFMEKGSLQSLIEKPDYGISLRRKLDMACNIASGMRKIHEHNMIHRDIRPDNILVNNNFIAKIGDMGIARTVDENNRHTQIGCQVFMPLEFYKVDQNKAVYDQKLDIYTFGLTLNALFTDTKHGFHPLTRQKLVIKQSPVFWDLISRCTDDYPEQRPTALEMEKTLELYNVAFQQLVLQKELTYIDLSSEDKNKRFMEFYEVFHPKASEYLEKKFPRVVWENNATNKFTLVNTNPDEKSNICFVQ
ncbi:unnamed protein product, partial [Didymodactylos carnosus]